MAHFNPARPSYIENPYPALARLRAEAPVYRSPEAGAWVVTSYEACRLVLQDGRHFSANARHAHGSLAEHARETAALTALGDAARLAAADDPDHARLRRVVDRAFTPRSVEAMRLPVSRMTEHLLRALDAGLVDVATVVPAFVDAVIMAALGVPEEEHTTLREAARAVIVPARSAAEREWSRQASDRLRAYLDSAGADGAGADGADAGDPTVLSLVVAARRAEQISDEEMIGLAADLIVAGSDASIGLVTNGLHALSQAPGEFERLRGDPSIAPRAVDELLRFDAPVHAIFRWAAAEVKLGSQAIRRGDGVVVVVGAGNRDPVMFTEPDRLDLARDEGRTLSFSLGMHHCIGAPLARIAAAVLLEGLAQRYAGIRPASNGRPVRRPDWMNRGFASLPLEFVR